MTETTTLSQLDAVLTLLYKREKHYTFLDISEAFKYSKEVDFGDILSILNKLQKDGFIEFDDRSVQNEDTNFTSRVYRVTFDGRYWIDQGGYAGNKKREDRLVSATKVNQNILVALTWVLAISALVSALYYGAELYWKYGWFRHWK